MNDRKHISKQASYTSRASQTDNDEVFRSQGIVLRKRHINTPKRMINDDMSVSLPKRIVLRQALGKTSNKPIKAEHNINPSIVIVSREPIEHITPRPKRQRYNNAMDKCTSIEDKRNEFLHALNLIRERRVENIYKRMMLGMDEESALKAFGKYFGDRRSISNKKMNTLKSVERISIRSLSAKEKNKRIKQYGRWYIDPKLYAERLKLKLIL